MSYDVSYGWPGRNHNSHHNMFFSLVFLSRDLFIKSDVFNSSVFFCPAVTLRRIVSVCVMPFHPSPRLVPILDILQDGAAKSSVVCARFV